jgi:hypothetical protein
MEELSKVVVIVEPVVLDDDNEGDCQNLRYGPTLPVISWELIELHEHDEASLCKKSIRFY